MGARILIIEDNRENLELMTYLLSAFGHTVVAAEDGICGLAAAIRETPDLVVCDLQLPDIDGFEVARQLRSTSVSSSSLPLVAVTALAMVGDRDRVLTAGFDAYLTKPIDPETFVQEIESHLLCRFDSVPRHSPHHTAESMKTAPREQRFTILAVDNLAINLYLVMSILTPSGFKVLTANGVSEGLALARQSPCDLIVSDVCMGSESGYDFLIAVRSDPQLSSLPFILITSTMMSERDRERGLALGADRFLRRPIEPQVLLHEISECLREKGRY
jgi:two-component system cell cycle response regulator